MGFGTKLAAGIDSLLHVGGFIVVLAVWMDYLEMPVSWCIAAIVVTLIGLPYPGLHEAWDEDEDEDED